MPTGLDRTSRRITATLREPQFALEELLRLVVAMNAFDGMRVIANRMATHLVARQSIGVDVLS